MLAPTDQKFVGLYGVENNEGNYVSVLAKCSSGTYTVDWGDGTVDAGCTSGVKKDHWYDYSDADLGAAMADGYKAAVVTITPDSGNLTKIDLQQKHSLPGLPTTAFNVNWLDIAINGPSISILTIGGTTVSLGLLRKFTLGTVAVTSFASLFNGCRMLVSLSPLASTAAVTSMGYMFSGCTSLQSIPAFPGSVAAVTDMSYMFYNCYSLQAIPAFPGSVAAVKNMSNMFSGCTSLQSIPAFPGSVEAVTNMSNMFYNCYSLQAIPAFPGSVKAVTAMYQMFYGCYSLQTIPAFPGSVAAVTTMRQMFSNCYSLQTIPAFPGSVANVTTMYQMFSNCYSLQTIPAFPGSVEAVENMSYMFSGCTSLQTIPAFPGSVAAVTDMRQMFTNCISLQTIPAFETNGIASATPPTEMFSGCRSLAVGRTNGIRYSVSYDGCKLSAAQLNAIFTGLGTADNAGGQQTVTITGNYGAATCDQTIATGKGWTVTN
ncbi:MAG TPA: BspA family leucine-rich repeat surface protein [Verrucomicrobiota bacterium]|nr:BspA family leucine-rich repeat surface protein [Verrucomicrobiota bacterium]